MVEDLYSANEEEMIFCTTLYMLTLGSYFSRFADQVHSRIKSCRDLSDDLSTIGS